MYLLRVPRLFRLNRLGILLLFLFTEIDIVKQSSPEIIEYEYGERVSGDTLSYVYVGMVPAYQPHYNFSVKLPFLGSLSKDTQLTYLRVHYSNPLSKVNVSYNPEISTLEFFIKYPFMSFPFGIDAYSYKVPRYS